MDLNTHGQGILNAAENEKGGKGRDGDWTEREFLDTRETGSPRTYRKVYVLFCQVDPLAGPI